MPEKNLSEDARCNLGFTLAKIYEDIGNIDKSYEDIDSLIQNMNKLR